MSKRARNQRRQADRQASTAAPSPVVDVWADWPGASALKFADAGEVLERLEGAVRERDRFGVVVDDLVQHGRSQGLTWTQLARALGVSPQAVQKRYGTRKG